MRKEMSRVFLGLFLFVLLFGVFAVGDPGEPDFSRSGSSGGANVAPGDTLASRIGWNMFEIPLQEWSNSELRYYVGAILLGFIYFLIIFDIVSFLPFFRGSEYEWRAWAVSAAIAILGFLFIDPAFISAMTTTYEALAIAVTTVIPFLLLFIFVYRLEEDAIEGKMPAMMARLTSTIVLWVFLIYLIYKTIYGANISHIWYYLIAIIAAILMIFYRDMIFLTVIKKNKKTKRKIFSFKRKEGAADVETVHGAATEEINYGTGGKRFSSKA